MARSDRRHSDDRGSSCGRGGRGPRAGGDEATLHMQPGALAPRRAGPGFGDERVLGPTPRTPVFATGCSDDRTPASRRRHAPRAVRPRLRRRLGGSADLEAADVAFVTQVHDITSRGNDICYRLCWIDGRAACVMPLLVRTRSSLLLRRSRLGVAARPAVVGDLGLVRSWREAARSPR